MNKLKTHCKNIAILGSTGSIGTQTLQVVRESASYKDADGNSQELNVVGLAAGRNAKLLEEQIREFKPRIAVLYDEKAAAELKQAVQDIDVKVLSGMEGLIEMSRMEGCEMLVTGIVGMIGIRPTIAAIETGKDIALANKETLVCAGHIIMSLAKKMGVKILPVDSEHSAIFQSLQSRSPSFTEGETVPGAGNSEIRKILLTASGGPFRGMKKEDLAGKTCSEALKHPNWNMGAKVTIDSASLVNKGLEVMEARWLFGVPVDDITVVIHPQSILHSAVEYTDGAVVGQMGTPDMKLPIRYALFYPERKYSPDRRLDLFEIGSLTFEKPDTEVFKGLALALRAAKTGGSMPTVFNAANEVAVARFLKNEIGFLDIYDEIEKAMDAHVCVADPDVGDILEAEKSTHALLGGF